MHACRPLLAPLQLALSAPILLWLLDCVLSATHPSSAVNWRPMLLHILVTEEAVAVGMLLLASLNSPISGAWGSGWQ